MQIELKNKFSTDIILLLVILIIATILRFWNFSEMPFMHDELSALERTNYNNVHDEIAYGVALYDTHPAGVQLFIYYWVKLFGINEMLVKLPFILCGIFSIIITYKISVKWFNSSVGLIVASFMATMQYMVMYSQLARPYISGLFFSLLMVWCWSNYLFDQENKGKTKWLTGYILSSALCAYDHHFTLLFAAIVGFTGLFFISKNTWKLYILAGISIFVLYIPHLNIFFSQFNKGGLGGPDGWLGKPDADWLLNYLKYIFHFSNWMYILGFLLLAAGILYRSKDMKINQKFRIIALSWFLLVFCIEYFYSVFVNPIIQYSTLIFVFPFLLIFLFSLLGELSSKIKILIVFAILITGTSTLVFSRKHYLTFYKQPYQGQVLNTYKYLDMIKDKNNATIELGIQPYFKAYYFKKYNRRFESIYYNSSSGKLDTKAFRKFIQEQTTAYFIAGNLPLAYLQIIKEKYPYIISKDQGFTYSTCCFSIRKSNPPSEEKLIFVKVFDLSGGKNKIDSNVEFAEGYSFKIKDITNERHNILNVSIQLSVPDSASNPVLVVDIQENNTSIEWSGAEYFNFNNNVKKSNIIYLSKDLTSFNFREHPDATVNIYLWNKDKKEVVIDNFKMNVTEGNHLIYSLYEPVNCIK